jgi:hypothetical protein
MGNTQERPVRIAAAQQVDAADHPADFAARAQIEMGLDKAFPGHGFVFNIYRYSALLEDE